MKLKVLSYILLLSIPLIVAGCTRSYKKEYEEIKDENEILKVAFAASKIKLEKQIQILSDSNTVLLDSIRSLNWICSSYEHESAVAKPSYWFDEYNIEKLQELGFKNPQKEILDDLYNNKDLFTEDGILGGTMQIESATLIGTSWAIAIGEDGHIAINYLLEYTVQKNKRIKWKILNRKDYFN